jgi:phosphoglycerol transferase MdoB-like AlkP superfamily enzyme
MSDAESVYKYPGIDRQQYFLGKIGMIVAAIFVVLVFGPASPLMRVLGLVLLVATVVLDVLRLQNMGVSQWFAFIRFLPFGNLILDIGLQSAQTGWAETRQLDSAGKRILIFNLVLLALMMFLAWRARIFEVPMYF